jgi:hypothetical protein
MACNMAARSQTWRAFRRFNDDHTTDDASGKVTDANGILARGGLSKTAAGVYTLAATDPVVRRGMGGFAQRRNRIMPLLVSWIMS